MLISVAAVVVLILIFAMMNKLGSPQPFPGVMKGGMATMEMAAPMDLAMDSDEGYGSANSKSMAVEEAQSTERMIIKTGSLSMVVDDVNKAIEEVIDYAEEKGGFLVSSNVNKYGLELQGSVTVRVPAEILDATVDTIKEMGDLESEYISGRDVTEEYTDLDSRLKNLKATEGQFLEIMKKAKEIEDVLAVQKELGNVRGDIEVITGRIKYLKDSVSLSSLSVHLSTDPSMLPVVDKEDKWKPLAVFKSALRSLLGTGQGLLNGVIWLGVYIPVIAVIGLVVWVGRRYFRKKK